MKSRLTVLAVLVLLAGQLLGTPSAAAAGGETPAGSDVEVAVSDRDIDPVTPGDQPGPVLAHVTFSTVAAAGQTYAGVGNWLPWHNEAPVTAPPGYQVAYDGAVVHVNTSAEFSGTVRVCVVTTGQSFAGGTPVLYHVVGESFTDVTTTRSSDAICGQSADLGGFAVLMPIRTAGTLIDPGYSYVRSVDGSLSFTADGSRLATLIDPDPTDSDNPLDVVVMNPDGSDKRTVTTVASGLRPVSLSPDGSLVNVNGTIFDVATGAVRGRGGLGWADNQHQLTFRRDGDSTALGLSNVFTAVFVPILVAPPGDSLSSPRISHDGTKIAFKRSHFADPLTSEHADSIEVVSIDGGAPQVVVPPTGVLSLNSPRWSPDGARIAYAAQDVTDMTSTGTWLEVVNADGTNRIQLKQPGAPDWLAVYRAQWTADSKRIVYERWSTHQKFILDNVGEIVVSNADGTGQQVADTGTLILRFPGVLSPDGTKYYASMDDMLGGFPLYAIDVPAAPAGPVNTPAGAPVVVEPALDGSTAKPARVTFQQVTTAGFTTATTAESLVPPAGYRAGVPARAYSLATTAGFAGSIDVCVDVTGDDFGDREPQLFRFTDGGWESVTTSYSYTSVCGRSEGLGAFGVFVDERPVGAVVHDNCAAPLGYDGASFSPNGTQVVVQCVRNDTGAVDLVVMSLDGSGRRTLLSAPASGLSARPSASVYWSPDGTKIAFDDVVIVVATGTTDTVAPYAQGDDGSGNIVCTQCRHFEVRGWLADSKRLFVTSRRADGTASGFGTLDSVTDAYVPTVEGPDAIEGAALSKSKTAVAFARMRPNRTASALEVVNLDGTGARVVGAATDSRWYRAPRWSPDSTRLAYELKASASAPWAAGSVQVDGTGAIVYGIASEFRGDPRWTPNSRRVLYVSEETTREGSAQIELSQADGSGRMTVDTGWLTVRGGGQLSPDGAKYFVTTTSRDGVSRIRALAVPADSGPSANTPAGTDVAVRPTVEGSSETPVGLTFERIVVPGDTVITATSGPPPPTGFRVGDPSLFYEVTTTADFIGSIEVCISTAGVTFPGGPRLFHFEDGAWVDTTTSISATEVCGTTTSLSPFAVFAPAPVAPSYQLEMHDDGKPKKVGSAVDFEVVLLLAGQESGSTSLTLVADSVDDGLSAAAPGDSNPGRVFTYDPVKRSYHYRLKSTGLTPGRHTLFVRIGNETALRAVPFELR